MEYAKRFKWLFVHSVVSIQWYAAMDAIIVLLHQHDHDLMLGSIVQPS